ncbi:serine/threonine-protein kinase Nek11-like isoform X2 [Hyperolius riggenbachi]|uniref:serine/threonine-protein kinase Nek11-like isoform X2 n=1 Tax=Hyperolius riggenbachi TaxID=752182 RepID=UPI0035A34C96
MSDFYYLLKVIKRIFCNNVKADATLPSTREAKLLGSLRHPFIVRSLGSFLEKEDFCIVTEYCEGGDLHGFLQHRKEKGRPLPEDHVMEWFIQLLLGVSYLHERLVMHRDLKTRNIFLQNGTLKIGDFGVSRILAPADLATTLTGTASYMSPEIFTGGGYNTKSDIWSLGCILYEICTFSSAFVCPTWIRLVSMIVNDPSPDLPPRYTAQLNDLLQRMLTKEPELRPSAREILNFPYVVDTGKVLAKWLQEVLNDDQQSSVGEDAARIAAAMQEKLHLDSLRAMREVQEMEPRQRRRIRQDDNPQTYMRKLKRAVERVYQENHQNLEEKKQSGVSNKIAWVERKPHRSDGGQRDAGCAEEEDSEEEETYNGSVLTLSLPLSEQQNSTLNAYQSCLQRFLDSGTDSSDAESTITLDSEETLTDKQEIVLLRQNCIRLLGEDGFWEVYHYLKQLYDNRQDTANSDLQTLCEPQVMNLFPHHCYKVQQLLFLEERMGEEPVSSSFSWL